MSVNIAGLDKVELLYALWNSSSPAAYFGQFMGREPPEFDWDKARAAVNNYIDYFCGRCIKLDLRRDSVDPCLFDRDFGHGCVTRVVQDMRAGLAK